MPRYYIPLGKVAINKLEKAMNRLLGGHYFPVKEVDIDGDGNIDRVVVDFNSIPRQADENNIPTTKYWVNVSTLKWHLDGRGGPILAKIKARYNNVDIKQYIRNNRVHEDQVIFYKPPE